MLRTHVTGMDLEEVKLEAHQEAISCPRDSRFYHLLVLPTLIIIHQDGKRKNLDNQGSQNIIKTGEWMKHRDSEKVSVASNGLS